METTYPVASLHINVFPNAVDSKCSVNGKYERCGADVLMQTASLHTHANEKLWNLDTLRIPECIPKTIISYRLSTLLFVHCHKIWHYKVLVQSRQIVAKQNKAKLTTFWGSLAYCSFVLTFPNIFCSAEYAHANGAKVQRDWIAYSSSKEWIFWRWIKV